MSLHDEPLQFRVLGTFEITRGNRRCTPTAPKQRALLALLALHANEFVATRRIVDQPAEPRLGGARRGTDGKLDTVLAHRERQIEGQ